MNPSASVTLASVSVNPTSVQGGKTSTGTVTLAAPAAAGGVSVELWTNGDAAFVPTGVTVAAGSTTGTFTVTTNTGSGTRSDTVTAFYNGTSKTAAISVTQ
jgi:trimeric autotransporter adhesin